MGLVLRGMFPIAVTLMALGVAPMPLDEILPGEFRGFTRAIRASENPIVLSR